MKTEITDLVIALRVIAIVLSVVAISISGTILWLAHGKLPQTAIGLALGVFPAWALFLVVAEWIHQQMWATNLRYGEI